METSRPEAVIRIILLPIPIAGFAIGYLYGLFIMGFQDGKSKI